MSTLKSRLHRRQVDSKVFFFFLFEKPSFPGVVRPMEQATICLSMEEVAVHAGHVVLMEVDNNVFFVTYEWAQ